MSEAEVGPAGMEALRLMAALGGELLIDLSHGAHAVAAAIVCITLARDGLCVHTPTEYIAGFTLTDAGRRLVEGGRLH
ncbi:hypothetical protein [Roseomonas xinghualingensis]|uniref:hypothetical protein n=1 Tax=Roseomonas xinghualingensis TaxID=2986475 RepID=UPI0021F17A5C|nr:hypothetical protein [Roseomonas sp. SXEYE001]MCV4208593.1 hypothetical protein [Roseomonas sp. SXEYE001]